MSLTPGVEATMELVLTWVRNLAEQIDELRAELEADIQDLRKLRGGAR